MIDYSECFGRVFFLGKKAHHLVRECDCVCVRTSVWLWVWAWVWV